MRTHILLLMLLLTACSVKSQKDMNSFFEIDFQDFFKNDTISFEIGHQPIFKNVIVNSDFSTGLTELTIKVVFNGDGGVVKFGTKSIEIKKIDNPIEINVYLNGHQSKYTIDLKQGRYIGLSKKSKTSFDFYQEKEPFEYD